MSSNEYMNQYMKKRYAERRTFALNLLGNKCASCGETNLQVLCPNCHKLFG